MTLSDYAQVFLETFRPPTNSKEIINAFKLPNSKLKYAIKLGIPFAFTYELFIVYPSYHDNKWQGTAFKYFVAYCVAMSVIILFFMHKTTRTDTSIKSLENNEKKTNDCESQLNWRYCNTCECNVPPRSHHCSICDVCILKRDHHCYFSGCCIGYKNQRYFICMVFYFATTALFLNYYNWDFVLKVKGGFTWTTIPEFVAPHIGLAFGYYSFFEFAVTACTSLGVGSAGIGLGLLCNQFMVLITGQTLYEYKKGIKLYMRSLEISKNDIFGSTGLLVFLNPFSTTTLPGDGSHFESKVD